MVQSQSAKVKLMLRNLKDKMRPNKKLFFKTLPLFAAILIFVNSTMVKSLILGFSASLIFLIVSGFLLGRVFFDDEPSFLRLPLGLFAFMILLALIEMLSLTIFQTKTWYLLGVIIAATVIVVISLVKTSYGKAERNSKDEKKESSSQFLGFRLTKASYLKLVIWGLYVGSSAFAFSMLFKARSGWVEGTIWKVVPPSFLPMYLFATLLLIAIATLPGKSAIKLLPIAAHAILSLSFIFIVSYPGIILYDPWVEMGRARAVLPGGNIIGAFQRDFFGVLNYFLRGLAEHVLIATLSGMLTVDIYWVYVSLVPVFWGFFAPFVAFAITKTIGGDERTSALSAVLILGNVTFFSWGILTEANSFGNVVFFMFLYMLLKFLSSGKKRTVLIIIVTLATLAFTHPLPAALSISFLILALALKKLRVHASRSSKSTYLVLFVLFVAALFLLPFAIVGRGIVLPRLGTPTFSWEKLLNTDIWLLIFGFQQNFPFKTALLVQLFVLLGLIGFAYALKEKSKFNKHLSFFLLLGFIVCLIDYRIMEYAMQGGLFGAGRIDFFRDIVSLPFASIVIASVFTFLSGGLSKVKNPLTWRYIFACFFVGISMSSLVTMAVYETYAYYSRGLLPTSLEVDAVKYIDANTDRRYVVVTGPETLMVGWGFVGIENFEKYYIGKRDFTSNPSLTDMIQFMTTHAADVGYLIVSSFRTPDFDNAVTKASQMFGLFATLNNENGKVCIFQYRLPPSPRGLDVEAFYWDTPSSYIIQNNLMRVVVNLEGESLEVRDYWGVLYEDIYLNQTLADGSPLGNLVSVEYFNSTDGMWVTWAPHVQIPYFPALAGQFQFKLRFERDSLVGVVEREKPFLSLWSENARALNFVLRVGDFTRAYIPGLIGGENSYNVSSREFGLLYTISRTENVVLHPVYNNETETTSLNYSQVARYCNLKITTGYLSYDFYVENKADLGQWAYVEVWLPDVVHGGSFPPVGYSLDDGKTWSDSLPYSNFPRGIPLKTFGGAEVNWIFSQPQNASARTLRWRAFTDALGGPPLLPQNFTASGGGQNRILFGFYLPAGDKALVRLGASIYGARPLKVTYIFRNSSDIAYGLHNIEKGVMRLYTYGPSQFVGGLTLTDKPASLAITEDEYGKIKSMLITIPANATFSLFSGKGVDTTIDNNENGIPDAVE